MSAQGEVIRVGDHAHAVEIDLIRYELGLARTFNDYWDGYIRIPYFIKDQLAEVTYPDPISTQDQAAARRAGYNHHRTETYEGFSDLELGVGRRFKNVLGIKDSILRISLGFTIPTGETEEDPLIAGDLGTQHLHIQFGNGTIDPLLDAYLGIPLSEHWAMGMYGRLRLPFYENAHGYRGSLESTVMPRISWLPTKKLSLATGVAGSYFGHAYWNGRQDPNSGQALVNWLFNIGYKWNESLTTSMNVLLPFYTKSFSDEDVLDPAPTFSLAIGWTF